MRLIWWLAAVVLVGVVSIALSERRALDPAQNLSLTVAGPLEHETRQVARPVNDFITGITNRGGITRENRELRDENERLRAALAEQADAQQRVSELEDALEVKQSRPEDRLLAADVIAQETSGLKRAIAIDRGLNDGVDEGMVILSRGGSLVGTVSRAYEDYAWVRLITDPESSVNAQVHLTLPTPSPTPVPSVPAGSPTPTATPAPEPTVVRLIAKGDLRDEVVLDLLPSDVEVHAGDLILTSGHGGNYPRGLLIGTVEDVEDRPQSPFKAADVEPATSLPNLDAVLVLMSFQPVRLAGP